ncbi:MAG: hypothetical protein OEL20_04500 [Sulfuritalea sp.]|nr:hypothetical protein [Sulfuritalea sp.]
MTATQLTIMLVLIVAVGWALRSRLSAKAQNCLVPAGPVIGTSVIRELGQATLFVHQREEEGVSAHMIVWQPVASETAVRVQETHIALCMFPGGRIENQMIDDALALAKAKLATLKVLPGVTKEVAAAVPIAGDEPAVKRRKVPVVHRGTILQMGKMPRTQGTETITMYGVTYRNEAGAEDTVWGIHLRSELKAVGAGVGDRVEITKVGRKVLEEGKAPMTVFEVKKL